MDYNNQQCGCGKDRKKLLCEIGKVDFALKDLNLYLDTHPYDQQALDAFGRYNSIKKQLTMEYTENFGPIVLDMLEDNCQEWKWALQDWPWERGYY